MEKQKKELSEKQRKTIYIISILIFIAIAVFLTLVVGQPLVDYAKEPEKFKQWLDSYGIFSRIVFVAIVTLQVVIAIIPGEPFEIAAGYCFGTFEGLLLTLIGITLGCLIIFKLVERYQESIIKVFFKETEFQRLSFLKDPLKAKNLAFILNVIPGIPKDILSYFVGLTSIPLGNWLLIVFIGRIPSVITSTIAGDLLSKQQYGSTTIVFIITAVISLVGLFIYNLILKKNNSTNTK